MGFFAVVSDRTPAPFQVEKCHLNLWTLGGLFGYRVCYLDVGLLLAAGDEDTDSFRLALPVATRPNALRSLRDEMRDATVGSLIFAREEVVFGDSVVIDNEKVPLLQVANANCSRSDHPDRRNFSEWRIALSEKLAAGRSGYLRLRFVVHTPGRVWLWRPSLPLRGGAVVDVRVSDEREAQTVPDADELTRKIVPLEELEVFVIAPAAFEAAAVSPEPRYIRSLEGRVWEGYLKRSTDMRRAAKFLVYRWKGVGVTSARPFRGLIQLRRHPLPLPTLSQLSWGVAFLAIFVLVTDVKLQAGALRDCLDDIWAFLTGGWFGPAITLAALLTGVILAVNAWDLSKRARERFAGLLGRIDEFVYSKRRP